MDKTAEIKLETIILTFGLLLKWMKEIKAMKKTAVRNKSPKYPIIKTLLTLLVSSSILDAFTLVILYQSAIFNSVP